MPFKKGASGNPDKAFKKGTTGNPNGRPKKIPALEELLADLLCEENDKGITAAQGILLALRNKAFKGDTRAAEILLDRAYGKTKQEVTNTNFNTNMNVELSKKDVKFINKALEDEY